MKRSFAHLQPCLCAGSADTPNVTLNTAQNRGIFISTQVSSPGTLSVPLYGPDPGTLEQITEPPGPVCTDPVGAARPWDQ